MQIPKNLPKPRNQMATLLYDLIRGKEIAEQDYPFNRFRGSLSDLRNDHSVPILFDDEPFVNSFGRKSRFRRHFIREKDRSFCINVYAKINL
jgi:hypothetical protein